MELNSFVNLIKERLSRRDPIESDEVTPVKELARHQPEHEDNYAVMPPIETFMGVPAASRRKEFYQYVQKGDILIGKILTKNDSGFTLALLCMDGRKRRDLSDLDVRVFCPIQHVKPLGVHSKLHNCYDIDEIIRVKVVTYITEPAKIIVSMREDSFPDDDQETLKLGSLTKDDELPVHYKKQLKLDSNSYDDLLRKTLSFNNPGSTQHQLAILDIPANKKLSLLSKFYNTNYPATEYASSLRRAQAAKWADKSLREGIRLLKESKSMEAHQQLSKALSVDPQNVDALVARGCLYANNQSLKKALEDFESALDLNPNHINARKYMSDTLLALGKIYESKNDIEAALQTYKKAVQVNIENQNAKNALKDVNRKNKKDRDNKSKNSSKKVVEKSNSNNKRLGDTKEKLKHLLDEEKKHKKRRKRRSSSSESVSSSSSSSSSSSTEKRSKKVKKSKKKKSERRSREREKSRSQKGESKKNEKKSYIETKYGSKSYQGETLLRSPVPDYPASSQSAPYPHQSRPFPHKILFTIKKSEPSQPFVPMLQNSITHPTVFSPKDKNRHYFRSKSRSISPRRDVRPRSRSATPRRRRFNSPIRERRSNSRSRARVTRSRSPRNRFVNRKSRSKSFSPRRKFFRSRSGSRSPFKSRSRSKERDRIPFISGSRSRSRSPSRNRRSPMTRSPRGRRSPSFLQRRWHAGSRDMPIRGRGMPMRGRGRGRFGRDAIISRAPDPQHIQRHNNFRMRRAAEQARKVEEELKRVEENEANIMQVFEPLVSKN